MLQLTFQLFMNSTWCISHRPAFLFRPSGRLWAIPGLRQSNPLPFTEGSPLRHIPESRGLFNHSAARFRGEPASLLHHLSAGPSHLPVSGSAS